MESLPAEVIVHILEILSFEDRRQLSLLNKTWYYASIHPIFLKKEILRYDADIGDKTFRLDKNQQNIIKNFDNFINMLLMSKRSLFNLSIDHLSCDYDLNVFTYIGDKIKSLHLGNLFWMEEFLDSISKNCKKLEVLELNNICQMNLISNKCRKPMMNIYSITFDSVNISDTVFNSIVGCAPKLNELVIYNCNIISNLEIKRQFNRNYQNEITNYISNHTFSLNVFKYLLSNKNINSLMLKGNWPIFIWQPLNIKLKKLILDDSNSIFVTDINRMDAIKLDKLLSEQKSLEHLEIINFHCCILMAVSKLHNLKHLNLKFHFRADAFCYSDDCFKTFLGSLCNMKGLKSLSLSAINGDWARVKIPDCVISSLTSLDCSIDDALKVINVGKKLTSFRIRNGNILRYEDLQILFNTQTNLRYLWIDNCIKLNDDILSNLPLSNLKGLISLNIMYSNLTYQCLQYLKLEDLESLVITNLSLGKCIELRDITDFEDSLKQFGGFVPALTKLELSIRKEEEEWIRELHLELFESGSKPFEILKPYFNRLKYVKLIRDN